jgi:maltoporin
MHVAPAAHPLEAFMSMDCKWRGAPWAGLVGVALALAAPLARAVDFDGYLRAGPGATSKNAARACYNLGIDGGHYRLGNECDFYGEFGLAQTTTKDGVQYTAKIMFNEDNPGTDIGPSYSSLEQMYVEGKGFDIAPGTNFWVGKRFYGRNDVHIVDTQFTDLSGVGAGADQIDIGLGKLGVAFFTSDSGKGLGDSGAGSSTNPAARVNVDWTSIPVNPGGQLRVTGTYTKGRFDNVASGVGTSGVGLGLQHVQTLAALGGSNTLWLQYANGSAGLNGNFGTSTAPTSVKAARIVDSLTWQAGPFGGQAMALYGRHGTDAVDGVDGFKEISLGGRVSYALTHNFKLVAEAGHMEKRPGSSEKQKLDKITFAPTLAIGPDFWSRPELRLYVTHASWNQAANAAAGPNGLTGLADGKTSGTSYGAQVEVWF